MGLSLMDGNQAAAWGAFDAGCRFFAGYPITPASGVLEEMLRLLPPAGGVVLQGEDEIASLGYCLGASMAGFKAMTATSGPGISLYSEHISLAVGSEIPVVIVNVQRLGPSTGSATRGADGDIQFMRWVGSGGLPVIVLAPEDAAGCYALTRHAFNLAETYRCPVFVASNKEIGLTRESVDWAALERPANVDRVAAPEGEADLPFQPAPGGDTPYFLPIGGERLSRQTSSTHGRDGYITTDPEEIAAQVERLQRKLCAHVDKFTFFQSDPDEGAATLVLTYGVTARAARQACLALRARGKKVSLAALRTLWPVPEKIIQTLAAGHGRVLVVEMNLGQYVREVRRALPGRTVDFLGGMDGRLISPEKIAGAVRD